MKRLLLSRVFRRVRAPELPLPPRLLRLLPDSGARDVVRRSGTCAMPDTRRARPWR